MYLFIFSKIYRIKTTSVLKKSPEESMFFLKSPEESMQPMNEHLKVLIHGEHIYFPLDFSVFRLRNVAGRFFRNNLWKNKPFKAFKWLGYSCSSCSFSFNAPVINQNGMVEIFSETYECRHFRYSSNVNCMFQWVPM